MSAKPLTAEDLFRIAIDGLPVPADRVLATFADPKNWIQIYNGQAATDERGYTAKACEWAFIGPVRPPFELAQYPNLK